MATRWEYRECARDLELWAELGEEGWEVVSVVYDPQAYRDMGVAGDMIAYFKRPLSAEPSTVSKLVKYTETDEKAARFMFTKIRERVPGAKEPNFHRWADDVRKMRELDHRSPKQIEAVFVWANADEFWSTNILSPATLRKHFDRLAAKQQQEGAFHDDISF